MPSLRDDVEKIVNLFLNRLAEKDPILKKEIENNKKVLVENMADLLLKQKPDLNPKALVDDKNFLKELSIAFVTSLTLNKLALDPNKNFFDRIKNIFKDKPDLVEQMKDPKFDPNSLEKLLSPEEKKQLQQEIQKCCAEILNDLKKLGLIKPKPPEPGASKPKLDEEMAKGFDNYTNLFGLVSSAITGGHPAVVQCFMGNGLGFPDWNPNAGRAQIDLQNRVDDQTFGDSLGLNASTMGRYLQFAGDSLIDTFKADLSTAPKMRIPGTSSS